jgi:hypothetical protein
VHELIYYSLMKCEEKLRSSPFNIHPVEKPAETQTSNQLASHLVKAPNSRSGGGEFEAPMRLGALTKSGKTLRIRSFYNRVLF